MKKAMKVVRFVVKSAEANGAPLEMRQDLFSEGLLGLAEAAPLYDAEKGAALGTYAYHRIRGRISSAIRNRRRYYQALPPWFTANEQDGSDDKHVPTVQPAVQLIRPGPNQLPETGHSRTIESRITAGRAAMVVARLLRRLPDAPRRLVVECAMKRRPVAEVSRELRLERRKATRLPARAMTEMRRRLDQQGYSLSDFV